MNITHWTANIIPSFAASVQASAAPSGLHQTRAHSAFKREEGGPARSLQNDFDMHQRVLHGFSKLKPIKASQSQPNKFPQIGVDESNHDCMIRPYLGRKRTQQVQSTRPSRSRAFSLKNNPFACGSDGRDGRGSGYTALG